MIDIVNEIDAVEREVGSGRIPAGEGRAVILRRTYEAPIDEVWDALTNPDRIGRWFLPISGDYRIGGHYQFEGNAGGEILECARPNRLRATWAYGPGEPSEVEVRLASAGDDKTVFELEHTAVVPDEMWDQYGPGAVGVGWDLTLLGLAWHLESGGTIGSKQGMAWLGTPEGKDFVRRTSDDWGRASIDSGTDATAARAAAERTRAAYTGDVTAPEA